MSLWYNFSINQSAYGNYPATKEKAAMAKDVSVKVYVEHIDQLVHNDANPRLIKNKEHQALMKSLKEFPEMKLLREIVIDENNVILAGDKRVYALEELGYAEITVKQAIGLTEAQKREFIAKDNIHNGEWDKDIIANLWDSDELTKWGVPDFKLAGLGEPKQEKQYQPHDVTCPECGYQFTLNESE